MNKELKNPDPRHHNSSYYLPVLFLDSQSVGHFQKEDFNPFFLYKLEDFNLIKWLEPQSNW